MESTIIGRPGVIHLKEEIIKDTVNLAETLQTVDSITVFYRLIIVTNTTDLWAAMIYTTKSQRIFVNLLSEYLYIKLPFSARDASLLPFYCSETLTTLSAGKELMF